MLQEGETLVKSIVRRLRRLEDQARPMLNESGLTPAEVLRNRRRRRLEAEGLRFEELPREAFVGAQSLSEAIRMGRKWVCNRGRTGGAQMLE
jgi:hypothetical protein